MAKSVKRKARKKLILKLDIMIPIQLHQLGTEEDPCFGKEYSSTEPECLRCGDSELCIIKMGQLNTVKRLELEKTSKFKDIQPEEFKVNTQLIYKWIQENAFITSKRKKLDSIILLVEKEFRLKGKLSRLETKILIRKIATQAVDLGIVTKEGVRYLKCKN